MQAFPLAILGVFLVVAGTELMRASGFWRSARALPTALVMMGVHRATGGSCSSHLQAAGWSARCCRAPLSTGVQFTH